MQSSHQPGVRMAYVLHWDIKDNGALALLAGTHKTILDAYTLFADSYGNTWASSRGNKTGALNKATGFSHPTIAKSRAFMEAHGVIKAVPRETVKQLYKDEKNKPPANATVWHISGQVAHCDDPDCTCKEVLQVSPANLYYIFTSKESSHEVSTIKKKAKATPRKEEDNSKSPSPDGEGTPPPKSEPEIKAVPRETVKASPRGELFEAVLKHAYGVTYESGMALPAKSRQRVNAAVKELAGITATVEEVNRFYAHFIKHNPDITAPRDPAKIVLGILEMRSEKAKPNGHHPTWEDLAADQPAPEPPPPPKPGEMLWREVMMTLERQLPRETYNAWLRNAQFIELDGEDQNVFRVGVDNKYAREWLEHRLRDVVLKQLRLICGEKDADVRFELLGQEIAA